MIAGQLEIQLMANMARLVSDMDNAKRTVGSTVDTMNKVLGKIGVGVSFAGLAAMVKGVADVGDKLNDLRKITGLTVNELGGLDKMAKLNGTDLDAVAKAIGIMSKNMSAGERVFNLMGITIKDTNGKLRDANQVFLDVADKFSRYNDGAEKSALATELFGKSGRELIPLLSEGRAKLEEAAEAHRKYSGFTNESAELADKFNDEMTILQGRVSGVKNRFVNGLLPTLTDITGAFVNATQKVNEFSFSGDILSPILKGMAHAGYLVQDTFNGVMRSIGAIGAQILALKSFNFEQFLVIEQHAKELNEQSRASYDDFVDSLYNGDKALKDAADAQKILNNQQNLEAPTLDGLKDKNKDLISEYEKLIGSIKGKISLTKEEIDSTVKLTESDKIKIDVDAKIANGLLKLNDAQRNTIGLALQELKVNEKLLENKKFSKEQSDALAKLGNDNTNQLRKELDDIRAQNALIGKTREEIVAMAGAKERETAAVIRNAAVYAGDMHDAYMHYANDLETAAKLQRDLADEKELQHYAKEWEQTWSSIENTGKQAFIQLLVHGKSTAQALGDAIKTAVVDLLYQLTVRKWMINIGASLEGAFINAAAGSAAGTAAGGSSTLSTALSLGNIGSSALSLFRGGFGANSLVGGALSMMPGNIGAFGAGLAGGQAGSFLAAEATGGLASAASMGASLAAISGPLLAAFAATQGLKMLAGDKRLGGTFGGILNKIGDIPIIGDMIPIIPILNGLFGRGPLKQKETQLTGDVGLEGLLSAYLTTNFKAKGGLLVGSKHDFAGVNLLTGVAETDNKKLQGIADGMLPYATNLANTLKSSVLEITTQVKTVSGALNISLDPLKDFHHQINLISESGKALTDEQIAGEITSIGDDIVTRLVPSIRELAKSGETTLQTFSRLGVEFGVLTNAASLLFNKSAEWSKGFIGGIGFGDRTAFLDKAGGSAAFAAMVSGFAQNFLSDGQRIRPVIEALVSQRDALGLGGINTRDQYVSAVQSGSLNQDQLIFLLKNQDAIKNVFDYLDKENQQAIDRGNIYSSMVNSFNEQIQDITNNIEKLKNFSEELTGTVQQLQPMSRNEALQKLLGYATAAMKGADLPDISTLKTPLGALTNINMNDYSSQLDYTRARAQSVNAVNTLIAISGDKQDRLAAQIVAMRESFAESLANIARSTGQTATILDNVSGGGGPLLTRPE